MQNRAPESTRLGVTANQLNGIISGNFIARVTARLY